MSKGTTIISDLRSFFSENENNRAINAIMRVMECINIRPGQIGTEKKENCKFTNVQVLNLLMLFPFFVVRNAYRYFVAVEDWEVVDGEGVQEDCCRDWSSWSSKW